MDANIFVAELMRENEQLLARLAPAATLAAEVGWRPRADEAAARRAQKRNRGERDRGDVASVDREHRAETRASRGKPATKRSTTASSRSDCAISATTSRDSIHSRPATARCSSI